MKTKILLLALASLTVTGAGAQTIYDGAMFSQKDLNGTARFVGMGGAMGALGGDLSTMSINPAGIGIYRSNDISLTMGYGINTTSSDFAGNVTDANKYRFNLNNIGVVISNKIGNQTALRYVNFGFNYKKSKNFYKNMSMNGLMGGIEMSNGDWVPLSQTRFMAQQASNAQEWLHNNQGEQLNFGGEGIYEDNAAGWLGAMGYQGWLTNEGGENPPYYYDPVIPSEVSSSFLSKERGGIDQYDFNVSFNVNDRFYFGFTLGAYDVDYNKYTLYDEWYDNNEDGTYAKDEEYYSLETFKRIQGSGVDFKFGAIVRPFEYSPLRLGFAIHTPTYYKLTYTNGALLNSELYFDVDHDNDPVTPDVSEMQTTTVDTYEQLGGRDMDSDFELRTPWLFNVSMGYTVGKELALGAEYEYEDYSTMKFRDADGYDLEFHNDEADLNLKGVHTLRLGAEYKPIPEFSLRMGYNYSSALFKKEAVKYLPDNAIDTDTDFDNKQASNTVTLGIGYRGKHFYADLAYKYDTYKSDFYPFYNEMTENADNGYMVTGADYANGDYFITTPEATKVTHSRSQVLFTLGYRF